MGVPEGLQRAFSVEAANAAKAAFRIFSSGVFIAVKHTRKRLCLIDASAYN